MTGMRKVFSFATLFFLIGCIHAQSVKPAEGPHADLLAYERQLMVHSDSLINGLVEEHRSAASVQMIKAFSKALRMPGAFEHPFDSLSSIAVLPSPDRAFRIFTWQLAYDNGTHRYFGVIQMAGKEPQLFPLIDYSQFYENPDSVIVDHDRWIGALYYKIIPVKSGKQSFYTLFGWDANNVLSNKKVVEILWFDKDDRPKLGYPLFQLLKGKSPTRLIFEYKKDAIFSLTHIPEENMIYYDHLISLGGKPGDFKFDLVPDGTLEGLKWNKGKWQQVDMITYEKREDGDVPNVTKELAPPLYRPLPPR